MQNSKLTLSVNGQAYVVDGSRLPAAAQVGSRTLLEVLRDDLELGSVREGCGIGMCGTCTVLVDDRAISSCLMLAGQAEGKEILTVEGLAADEELHPIQQAYIDHAGFQCAYCTPGFILSTVALLKEYPDPDDGTIREYLAGDLCRCGSYVNILDAVRACRSGRTPLFGVCQHGRLARQRSA